MFDRKMIMHGRRNNIMLKMHNRSIAIFAGYKNQQVVSLIKYFKEQAK